MAQLYLRVVGADSEPAIIHLPISVAGETLNYVVKKPGCHHQTTAFNVVPGTTLTIPINATRKLRADGSVMFTGSRSTDVTVDRE